MAHEDVSALVPHPSGGAVLVVPTRSGYTLPTVRMDVDDELPARLKALSRHCQVDSPFLRRVTRVQHDGHTLVLKEFEPVHADHRHWLGLNDLEKLRLPEPLRPALELWVRHQRGLPTPGLRPVWARPGWRTSIQAWLSRGLRFLGIEPYGDAEIVQQWAISAVLRQPTREHGDFYAKNVFGGPGRGFWHEPALTAALDHAHPGQVPYVAAIDTQYGLILMQDMDITQMEERPPNRWAEGLRALARIQRVWVDRREELLELGCPDRGPEVLAGQLAAAAADSRLTAGLGEDERARVAELLPELRRLCEQMTRWPVPLSLGHGDFHPANAGVRADGSVCVFDWSDGAWTHPFLDAAVYTYRAGKARQGLWDSYLEMWTDYAPLPNLRQLIPATRILNALHQVVTYQGIIDNLDPSDHFVFDFHDATQWRRVLEAWDATG